MALSRCGLGCLGLAGVFTLLCGAPALAKVMADDAVFFRDAVERVLRSNSDSAASRSSQLGCEFPDIAHQLGQEAFCTHPYDYVCGPDEQTSQRRDAILDATFAQSQAAAYRAVAQVFGFSPPNAEQYERYVKSHPASEDRMDRLFLQTLRREVSSATEWDASGKLASYQRQIRSSFIAAIQAQPGIPESVKKQMSLRAAVLEPVDAGRILSGEINNPDLLARTLHFCKKSGLTDNAFQPPGTNYLVICPGALVLMRKDPKLPVFLGDFSGIAATLAHEAGHSCDNEEFPEVHTSMRACIKSHFPELSAHFVGQPKLENSYFSEISADLWAAETLAKTADKATSPSNALLLVRYALRCYCGFRDDGNGHPEGRFRIDVLFGKNPRLRQALGCLPALSSAPGCALEGTVPRSN